jgi:hypothetical protein
VTSFEAAAKNGEEVGQCVANLPQRGTNSEGGISDCAMFIEIPLDGHVRENLIAIREGGCFAKARTGGVTADAFPSAPALAGFIGACTRERVRWKATAGLHHPIRGSYRLTYEEGSPRGTMYGFLNVLLAAAMAIDGAGAESPGGDGGIMGVLQETNAEAFTFGETEITYRGKTISPETIARMRRGGMASFGSCSFTEPVDELSALTLKSQHT